MLIHGRHFFPLELLSKPAYQGYYMDMNGAVYSTKLGALRQLLGSTTKSGKYYTLNGVTYRADFLERSARAHARFASETRNDNDARAILNSPDTITAKSIGLDLNKANRAHATTATAGVKAKGFIIGTLINDKISIARQPVVHLTSDSVKAEMERLALAAPGTTFVSLKIANTVKAGGITWE